ncbi:MAG: peptidylprolyl isomerase [Oxalicibacterium faecigallinarum]|uniref:peptidylprolyl isomerase n=1 Tax=Oxalicibacterium faecigallinarum TaxID=573741 RepID=UPI0028073D98|nr:peptidylprolyl isomerase [Oxalicibacterium faecigallinarum]MDQ7970312.1 peptidylprolyl isomerase [Oxalicibacterium faecigallinarum]
MKKNVSTSAVQNVSSRKKLAWIAAFGLSCCLNVSVHAQEASATTSASERVQPRLADAILVVVNSDVITRYEFLQRLQMVEQRLKAQGGQMPPIQQLQRQLLERMIVEKAQLQQAKERGIKVDDAMLDRAVARIAEQNNMGMAEFRRRLEQDGMSYAAFREDIRREITMQRLREVEVDNKIQISDAEIDVFLEEHQAGAKAAAAAQELNIAQILIRVPENPTQQQLIESKRRADDVMAQLQAGGDFAKLAAAYSDSPDGLSGGELGWRSQDRLPQLFVEATAGLQQGQISQMIRSGNGFHILKLVGKRVQSVMRGGADEAQQQPAMPSVQQTHASHILIKVNQVVTAADARRKLAELKQRLDNHAATFEELARLYSNDFSASKGGDLGWIYPGDTVPEFERAMNELAVGQVSEPVESPFGYHLILVKERKVDDVSKERQRMAARQAIREQKVEEATQDWLRQVRDQAYVEYRVGEQ